MSCLGLEYITWYLSTKFLDFETFVQNMLVSKNQVLGAAILGCSAPKHQILDFEILGT